MGKAKKNVSKLQNREEGDDDSQEEIETQAKPVKATKGKAKPLKNASVESEEEEVDSDEVPSKKESKKGKAKKPAKGGKSKKDDSDDEEMEVALVAPTSAFALLAVESGDDDKSSEEEVVKTKSKKGKKEKAKIEEEQQQPEKVEEPTGKKGKRKGRKKDDEEDIEQMLAELELEYSGKKVEKAPAEQKKEPEVKKKGRKGKAEDELEEVTPEPEAIAEPAAVEEVEVSDKKKKKKKKKKGDDKVEEEEDAPVEVPATQPVEPVEPVEAKEEGEEQPSDKKKKKKKKKGKETEEAAAAVPEAEAEEEDDSKKKKGKKKGEEAGKKDKKGPGSKALAAMKEHLQKIKEEEERLQREQEEAERKAAEEERLRQEQLRIEQEKRDAKKQREREKKERLKAEGKFLTDKQRQALARSKQTLEALRAQGIDVPAVGEKRGPRPGTRVRPSKQKDGQAQRSTESEDRSIEEKAGEKKDGEKEGAEAPAPQVEEVKESWDVESSSSEEEEEEKSSSAPAPAPVPVAAPTVPARKKDDEEESSSEESDESDSEEDSDEDETDSSEDEEERKNRDAASKRQKALERIQKRREGAEKKRTVENLRAPVVCVLGHVDTGKTKILDKLRRTHVQDGEAGGITQQIGATNVPIDAIREASKMVTTFQDLTLKIPGLLIIDTPGHESFSNLRSRGSSLCDIAILVVDIMHGLEPQTIESINLLKQKKTPFVVALNKIDRLYDWVTNSRKDVRDLIKMQQKNTQQEFQDRTKSTIVQFAEQSLNAALFYENPDPRSYISMVPTSAATGDGMGNLMALIVELTQTALNKRLMYSEELHATVLEVKAIPGYGTTIDVILVNGALREGDTIVLAGTDGPIVTQIRSLLLPQPMKELRVKNTYTENKIVQAAQGVKITAKDLEKAIAGLNMLVAHHPDEIDICKEEVNSELRSALGRIKLQERGVYVQASTLGSLEALLEFLKTSEIPYSNIRIGPVVKKDVMKASIMLEHDAQYAVILAFDVKIERDAQEMADSVGVRIFQADIIYHLFDRFTQYRDELKQKKRDEFKSIAVFPCKLRIIPEFVFNSRDPIVVGVVVENGVVKEGTPLCVPVKEFVEIGIVSTIEMNHKPVDSARKGQEVCIKILPIPGQAPRMLGRHFEAKDMLVSKISRESIDACKNYFRDDLQKTDWQLMIELKKMFQIL